MALPAVTTVFLLAGLARSIQLLTQYSCILFLLMRCVWVQRARARYRSTHCVSYSCSLNPFSLSCIIQQLLRYLPQTSFEERTCYLAAKHAVSWEPPAGSDFKVDCSCQTQTTPFVQPQPKSERSGTPGSSDSGPTYQTPLKGNILSGMRRGSTYLFLARFPSWLEVGSTLFCFPSSVLPQVPM